MATVKITEKAVAQSAATTDFVLACINNKLYRLPLSSVAAVVGGDLPVLAIGTVTTLAAGSNATASIGGTAENPVLNLGIPKGDNGDAGQDGATGPSGQSAYAAAQAGGYSGTQTEFYADLAAMDGMAAWFAAL